MIGKSHPARVSLIGTLAMMTGIFGMIGGMVTLLLTLLLSFLQFDLFGFSPSNSTAVGLGVLLGLVLMILGVLWMVAGAGLLRGRRWGSKGSVAAIVLSVLGAIAGAGLGFYWVAVGLIVWSLAMFYFTRANVTPFFGQAGGAALIAKPEMLPASQAVSRLESLLENASNAQTSVARKCQNCGAMVAAGATVCSYCGEQA